MRLRNAVCGAIVTVCTLTVAACTPTPLGPAGAERGRVAAVSRP
ncbi:hypothetical protein HMPREF1529_03076, partial [Microbacterium sp. oral taxon 186 str. F0373]